MFFVHKPQGVALGFDGTGREIVLLIWDFIVQRSINARQEPQCGIKLGIFVFWNLCEISQTDGKSVNSFIRSIQKEGRDG
jgi:hypothetical protein